MTQRFTASEVRDQVKGQRGWTSASWNDLELFREGALDMLDAFVDMLEARERAVPVAWMNPTNGTTITPALKQQWLATGGGFADDVRIYSVPLYTHPPAASLSASEIEWLQYTVAHMEEDSEPEDRQCAQVIRGLLARIGATGEGDITNPPAASVTDAEDAARYRWVRDNGEQMIEVITR